MKNKIWITVVFAGSLFIMNSCKKTDSTPVNLDDETLVSRDYAFSENLTEDDNQLFTETINREDISGMRPEGPSPNNLRCANISVTPVAGFPKTVIIDFGTGCTSPTGVTRSGKIQIVISDSLRLNGTTSVMTFENYYVNRFKREGTITWTNQNTDTARGWERKVENGKITDSTGHFWTYNSIKNVVQVAGNSTRANIFDDAFSITGTASVNNDRNITRTATIISPLHKAVACDNVDEGQIKIQGPLHYSILDFGNGSCDRLGTLSIDGGTPFSVFLR